MKLGERIKELRKEKDMTQSELSILLEVDSSLISKWELGKKRPVYEDLIKMAKYFGVTTDYLLGVEEY
jgi:transcriptional regulator with XRE-family HTH domain